MITGRVARWLESKETKVPMKLGQKRPAQTCKRQKRPTQTCKRQKRPKIKANTNNLSEQNCNNFLSFQQTRIDVCIAVEITKNCHIFIAHAMWFIVNIMFYDL